MRLVLTGCSGRIGAAIWGDLCQRYQVTGFDRNPPASVPPGARFVPGDIRDREALARAMEGAETVWHLAAIPYDIPPLHEVFSINVQGTYNALELAVEAGASTFIYASSIMAYGFGHNARPRYLPVDEEHPALSNRPYGLGKILTEQLCRAFTERCGIRTICLRLTAAMWPGERYARLPFRETQEDEGVHQYFDVRDFIVAVEAATAAADIAHDVFLMSAADSGHVDPTPEVIRRLYPEAELRYERLTANSPLVSMNKARRLLGFEPRYSWRDGPATTGVRLAEERT